MGNNEIAFTTQKYKRINVPPYRKYDQNPLESRAIVATLSYIDHLSQVTYLPLNPITLGLL